MPSQQFLAQHQAVSKIYVASPEDGEGKTRNSPPQQVQRPVITNWRDTSFSRAIDLETCVHGTWSTADPTPATFLVFRCEFVCLKKRNRLESIKIHFRFVNTDPDENGELAYPDVVARGPYFRKYNASEGERQDENEATLDIGAAAEAKAGIQLRRKRGETHTQQYFEKVSSGRDYVQEGGVSRHEGVWWRFTQNESQDSGLTPGFRVAILLCRKNQAPFDGILEISEFDGGWTYDFSRSWETFTGKAQNVDDPIHFDPSMDPVLPHYEDEAVDKNNLGNLATVEGIGRKYAWIWGVDVGRGDD